VKEDYESVAWGLVLELEKRFLEHEVMTALGVVYL